MPLSAEELRVTPIRTIMTKEVVVSRPEDHLLEAAKAMRENRVSGLPVVNADREVLGVLSERDIVQELHRAAGLLTFRGVLDLLLAFSGEAEVNRIQQSVEHLRAARVQDVMSQKPVVVGADETVQEALRLMRQFGINRLPVTESGRLAGIVTRGDIISALAEAGHAGAVGPSSAGSGARKPRGAKSR